jgi:hypothetical protein
MTDSQDVIHYFNNEDCRDHRGIYGEGAFYDLNTTGLQANAALNLHVGQECVVATIAPDNQVVFTWCSFLHEARMRVDTPIVCRVLFGVSLMSETFSKKQAAQEKVYAKFFDKNGNFKAGKSWLQDNIPREDRPTQREPATSSQPEKALEVASINELRALAIYHARFSVQPKRRSVNYRLGSQAIHRYVLYRAGGQCEGCPAPAPFRTSDGSPYLEPHHATRLADNGPDHPAYVIALCPNCHRRAHYAVDAEDFNGHLKKQLAALELNGGSR